MANLPVAAPCCAGVYRRMLAYAPGPGKSACATR